MITLNSQSLKNHPALKTSPRFERARKKLGALSDRELLGNLQKFNQKECKLKVLVLLYLSEIDTRKLYLVMGYSSLFDFCTMHLRYTRATAARRIRSARAAAKYPEALELLLSGEINITTLSMISDILDQDNHEEILSAIRGRSTRAVELLVSRHRPVNIIRDTVRPICVRRRVEESRVACGTGPSAETNLSSPSGETKLGNQNTPAGGVRPIASGDSSPSAETKLANPGAQVSDGRRPATGDFTPSAETKSSPSSLPGRVILEQRLKLGFTVTPEFMAKYNRIKSLLSNKHPEGIDFETLFDILMNEYLERHDPDRRRARRKKRAANRDKITKRNPEKQGSQRTRGAINRDQAGKGDRRNKIKEPNCGSRHIPPAIRDQVYARDGGRCSFIGANGKRCGSTWDLEIDHVIPFAQGGNNSLGNLRLLCRKHNLYQAERAYGEEFMKHRTTKNSHAE